MRAALITMYSVVYAGLVTFGAGVIALAIDNFWGV
jgi:hypothetical protein